MTKSQYCLEDFQYDLPEELIAQEPTTVREASRLLCLDRASGQIQHRMFSDLPEILTPSDLLVVNDTKVIPARLLAKRETGALLEILLLRAEPKRPGVWLAMATHLRKLKQNEVLHLQEHPEFTVRIDEIVVVEGQKRLLLDFGSQEQVFQVLSKTGLAPLPPYIRRSNDASADQPEKRTHDLERYQTVFAQSPGAVAAPTAGLHFSQAVLERLADKGINIAHITLHVGPGTFKPITTSLDDHSIEAETFSISDEAAKNINATLDRGGRVIAVGTTSCRALETAGKSGRVIAVNDAQTKLYIKPGFQFQVVGGLVTNFHLSGSSLLVLVSAFAGYNNTLNAYKKAVEQRYRFFSYGDAMLITGAGNI